MDAETISLLIQWGPLAVVSVVFLWFFIVGAIRGTYKVVRRMIYCVIYIAVVWLTINDITSSLLDLNVTINGVQGVRNFIVQTIESNDSVRTFLSYSPGLKTIIMECPEIIISPILFIILVLIGLPLSFPIYWIYLIFFEIIARCVFKRTKYALDENGNYVRNEKGKKIKVKRPKRRLLGGLLRGAQGVVLICVTLLPVNFVNRIYNRAKSKADLDDGETLCSIHSSLEKYKDLCGYMDLYNETIFAQLGGEDSIDKIITDKLTTIEYGNKEFNLENELASVAVSAVLLYESGVMDLFVNGELKLDEVDFSVIKFEKLDVLVDSLFDSTLINELSIAGVRYVMNEVARDKLIEVFKDDSIVSKLEYTNSSEVEAELKDIISILKLAVEKNIADTVIQNKDNAIAIVNNVSDEDVEALLNKILSLRIINRAMPSVIKAYGEQNGVAVPDKMTEELNAEISGLFAKAVAFVQTMELTSLDDLAGEDALKNITDSLVEDGALKTSTKDELATLLNDLNQSYLFKNIVPTQINNLLKDKDYKVDGRVVRYVDTKEKWLNELTVLEDALVLYNEFSESEVVDYAKVTNLLNDMSGTKVFISLLPFAYDEILPQVGIEIDSEGFPVIDFDEENEDSSKVEFYNKWEGELTILKNIADSIGVLELQSLEDINIDLIKDEDSVDALATVMGEVYKSDLLKDPMVGFMKDTINEFVVDFDVEFSEEELLAINTKEKWKNELTKINDVLEIDFSEEENINATNLETVFDAVGSMELFKTKKIEILKYAIKESNFLTQEEYDSISWPADTATQTEIDAFWNNETDVLVTIVDQKDTLETLSNITVETMDTDEIGGLINEVMKSNILRPIVVSKVSTLLVDNGVKDDRDDEGSTTNLENSIASVQDWKVELKAIKEMVNVSEDNMDDVGTGEEKNTVEKMFESIENSTLLQNSRATLLLKAIETIDITDIPSDVTVSVLKANNYELYEDERDIIIEVSKNKSTFDTLADMDLTTIDTNSIGGLLDTITSSIIFEDYVVDQIATVLTNNDINDDKGSLENLKSNIARVNEDSSWKVELSDIKSMLNMDGETFDDVVGGKTNVELMFETIEESVLLQNSRASILIKIIDSVKTTFPDISVPAGVTSSTLAEKVGNEEYAQYNIETNVLISFAKDTSVVSNLGDDIGTLSASTKAYVSNLLDAMKYSKIFAAKYLNTVDSVLDTIDGEISKSGYTGVAVNRSDEVNGYVNISWSDEIEGLSVISANINEISKYSVENIATDKEVKIQKIGQTLGAIESSDFLGEVNAQTIANKVVEALTGGTVKEIAKPTGKTWSEAFNALLG